VDTGPSVRRLYEAYQARDWGGAATFLHPDAVVEMPSTAERLVGRETVIAFERAYPEPWGVLTVERVVADSGGAAAELSVVDPSGARFGVAAFWRSRDGLLHHGVEYWVTVGAEAPPPSRASSAVTEAARTSWERARSTTTDDH
jgi:ketosteroid isomerase-like protein